MGHDDLQHLEWRLTKLGRAFEDFKKKVELDFRDRRTKDAELQRQVRRLKA